MDKNYGKLINIMGIDGSGKTTLTMNLIEEFKKEGIIFEYRWAKFESKLLKMLIKAKDMLIVRERDIRENYKKSSTIKRRLFKNKLVSFLYEKFVIWDYIFQMIWKVKIPLESGKNIICDRYVYDTVVDLAFDLDYPDEKIKEVLMLFSKFLPKPDLVIFVDVPEEVAFSRKDDIPSIEFLRKKRVLYFDILTLVKNDIKLFILDGTKSPEELKSEALSIVRTVIRNEGRTKWELKS